VIYRLKQKNELDLQDFFQTTEDRFQSCFITEDKERKFFRNNISLIKKVLKYQEVYGLFDNGLQGVLLIYRSKGFRPYLKVLTKNDKYIISLLKYFKWNFMDKQVFCKLKKNNPLCDKLSKCGFLKLGDRGSEFLFEKKAIKNLNVIKPKDDSLVNEENRLY
jgi:hypothetical protein